MTQVKLLSFRTFHDAVTQDFQIQCFGCNEAGESVAITITDYDPFFYCRIPETWKSGDVHAFITHLKTRDPLLKWEEVRRKKLVGFDGEKLHRFLLLRFKNMFGFHRVKNLWYHEVPTSEKSKFNKTDGMKWCIVPQGLFFNKSFVQLYESQIPPLLRFFHLREISPSGWVEVRGKLNEGEKLTTCVYEFACLAEQLSPSKSISLCPFKICSFDIEARSSHGDFPIPVKDYLRLAQNLVDFSRDHRCDAPTLLSCVSAAFGFSSMRDVDLVYPKEPLDEEEVRRRVAAWVSAPLKPPPPPVVRSDASDDDMESDMVDRAEWNETHGAMLDEFPEDEDEVAPPQAYDPTKTVVEMLADPDFPADSKVHVLNNSLNRFFPQLEGDKCTFIGSTFVRYGEEKPYLNHCVVLNGCEPVPNTAIECYKTEKEVLLAWRDLILREDPDILIGYNIFGFDESFMFKRAVETNCAKEFLGLTRVKGVRAGTLSEGKWRIEEKSVFLASGEYELEFFNLEGRLQIDLLNVFRREYNLDSYKLDNVAGHFIGDKVKAIDFEPGADQVTVHTKNLQGLEPLNYIVFQEIGHSVDLFLGGKKFQVTSTGAGCFKIRTNGSTRLPDLKKNIRWALVKDDVDHHDIFRLSNGTDADRATVAAYCVQDTRLPLHLMRKVDILTSMSEMASICSVPVDFLVQRGQGIKLTSFVAKKCRDFGYLMPVLEHKEFEEGYEGAIVFEPKTGIYADPIFVCDYGSLYPSSMISENLSSDTVVWWEEYNLKGDLTKARADNQRQFDNLPGYTYADIEYDTYSYVRKTPKGKAEKVRSGFRRVRFATKLDGSKGIFPMILEELLKARKDTRKLIAKTEDPFVQNLLDKRQLAFKVSANSLYGATGARTSTVYDKNVAACCTATGRKLLVYAKTVVEAVLQSTVVSTKCMGDVVVTARTIYGDTDSIFVETTILKDGVQVRGHDAIMASIEIGTQMGDLCTAFLKPPHQLNFEKVLFPYIILSKKRYCGILYEEDDKNGKLKIMGLSLKRRDTCSIQKEIYGACIDLLMKNGSVRDAVAGVLRQLDDLVAGRVPIEKLTLTKALRSGYKKPMQICHYVLARRIGQRSPGEKPTPGDRIKYAFILVPNAKKLLQGDKIETPEFIAEHKLPLDYGHYVSNQIAKPLLQLFALAIEQIPGVDMKALEVETAAWLLKQEAKNAAERASIKTPTLLALFEAGVLEKRADKIQALKEKAVEKALFKKYLS